MGRCEVPRPRPISALSRSRLACRSIPSHGDTPDLAPGGARPPCELRARIVADILGQAPRLYRPPWGIVNAAALATARRLGLVTVLWSIQHEGLRPRAPAAQLRHVLGCDEHQRIVDEMSRFA